METDARPTIPPPTQVLPSNIDPAMQARLARLASNRVTRAEPDAAGIVQPAVRHRKRHAAKRSRAAAVLMSITTSAGLAAYFQHAGTASASAGTNTLTGVATASGTAATVASTAVSNSTASTTAASTSATSGSTDSTTATTATASVVAGSSLADGTYTGATDTNKWGPVQVQITVTNGQITKVVAVQTPTDDRKSISINAQATPTLASEVLSAQSANIDTVSGATFTSDSYKVSLQSAIDLAQATASQATAAP